MFSSIDIWQVLAGVAIFMLGSNFMDESLQSLINRKFKLFLRKQTSHKFRAITGGAVFSGLLQSSSIVNLLVLSLAGAGVIQLSNALAVVLGSNLGSTATNWLVASLGFGFQVEKIAFPLVAITGIGLAFITTGSKLYHWFRLLLGFSFLFVGLGFIKSGMEEMISHTNLGAFNKYPLLVFALLGLVITGIVQSSSTTIALALSSLYVNAITLPAAMAVLIGSETGTTLKLFFASVKGNPIKKRIALGNLLFNAVPAVLFLLLLRPSHHFITETIGIKNNLYALIFFQTLVNLGSIIIFYPVLQRLAAWLTKKFGNKKESILNIHRAPATQPATEALEHDTGTFIHLILRFCKLAVHIKEEETDKPSISGIFGKYQSENYNTLKNTYGELHGYYTSIPKDNLPKETIERLERLIACNRNGLYAAKSIQDAMHDIDQLSNSSNDAKYEYYLQARKKIDAFADRCDEILDTSTPKKLPETITSLYKEVRAGYNESLQQLYTGGLAKQLSELEISTLVNFNRETYTAFKSILFALKDYLLDTNDSKLFDELPGFIR
jgi:phosphate:Na+ symporter